MERILGDVHAHLCFGVDDGPKHGSEARQLLDLAAKSGTTHLWATPHVIDAAHAPSWETILHQVARERDYVADAGLPLELYPGAEVYMNPELLPRLGVDGAYCLCGGHYILVELPMDQMPNYADDYWYQLRLKGLRPIIAHPERYAALMHRPDLLEKWRSEGLLCQCNIGSFSGQFGDWARQAAIDLARAGLVDLVGSDAHNPSSRNTDMRVGLKVLKDLVDAEDFRRITRDNPLRIIQDEEIEFRDWDFEAEKDKTWDKSFLNRLKVFGRLFGK